MEPLHVSIFRMCNLLYTNYYCNHDQLPLLAAAENDCNETTQQNGAHPNYLTEISDHHYSNKKIMLHLQLYLGSSSTIEEEIRVLQILQKRKGVKKDSNQPKNTITSPSFIFDEEGCCFDDIRFTYERTYEGQEAAWIETNSAKTLKVLLEYVNIKQYIIPTRNEYYCMLCLSNPTIYTLEKFVHALVILGNGNNNSSSSIGKSNSSSGSIASTSSSTTANSDSKKIMKDKNRHCSDSAIIFNYTLNDYIVSKRCQDVIQTLDILMSPILKHNHHIMSNLAQHRNSKSNDNHKINQKHQHQIGKNDDNDSMNVSLTGELSPPITVLGIYESFYRYREI